MRQTYSLDDFILVPRYSELPDRNGDTSSCGYDMPIVMSPMDTITTPEMIDAFLKKNLMATVHRYFNTPEKQIDFVRDNCVEDTQSVFFAVGSVKKYKDWIDHLIKNGVTNFCVDMAHGDSELCVDTVKYLRSKTWHVYDKGTGEGYSTYKVDKIMAGNVVTKSGFGRIQEVGADYIRVGIGGGSICSTRLNTGFGLPQGSAIEDCAARKTTAKLIADGGIKHNGDIAKAIACGADMVMCGKMLAGTDLAGGECFDKDGNLVLLEGPEYQRKIEKDVLEVREKISCAKDMDEIRNLNNILENLSRELYTIDQRKMKIRFKGYHGMASAKAREGILSHGSIEGRSGLIPYTGPTAKLLNDLKLNLQASLSYNGDRNWEDFRIKNKKVFISNSGILESQTHLTTYND